MSITRLNTFPVLGASYVQTVQVEEMRVIMMGPLEEEQCVEDFDGRKNVALSVSLT